MVLVNGAPVDVTLATHTYIEALYPGDQGAVVVAAGDQVSNERTFAFFSPLIIADRLGSGDASETAGRFRTSGGALLVLRGKYFGTLEVNVTVGDKLCPIKSLTPIPDEVDVSEIVCIVPPGQGTAVPVVVHRGLQASMPIYISYQAPKITSAPVGGMEL
ncbi:MAG: IPT/TIG domain-containing protein, partial [Gemmobacter sp.]